MENFETIAHLDELESGKGKIVKFSGKEIAIFKIDNKVFAIDNECKHQGGPLGEGICNDGIVTCPWHNWRYDIKTGISPDNHQIKVQAYDTFIEGNDVKIKKK
jgi:methionine sulfoxide reductase heme-binding subunit